MGLTAEVLAALQHCRHDWRGVRLPYGEIDLAPGAKLEHIVGPAGLRAWPHVGHLPAAEGLPLHYGPGDGAIDISITHLDVFLPVRYLPVVQGMDPAGEAEGDGIGER